MADTKPFRDWGLVTDDELSRVVIVSPHLDDAVLGCGQLMAAWPGATVVTVFAGNPPAYPTPQREWDRQSGFAPGDDVMAARRLEDARALAVLDASSQHLDFIEYTYNPGDKPVRPATIAPKLADTIRALGATAVFIPFGLANPDHDVTHRACMVARGELADEYPWFCHEDSGYKHIPGMLAWRVAQLFRAGIWPTPVCPRVDTSTERKLRAVDCYPSQLLALEDDWQISSKLAAPAPEQYWRLAPPPAGWEGLAERM
jgi:LmbE family N-acetylglucosaminyl deacetylase